MGAGAFTAARSSDAPKAPDSSAPSSMHPGKTRGHQAPTPKEGAKGDLRRPAAGRAGCACWNWPLHAARDPERREDPVQRDSAPGRRLEAHRRINLGRQRLQSCSPKPASPRLWGVVEWGGVGSGGKTQLKADFQELLPLLMNPRKGQKVRESCFVTLTRWKKGS